MFIPEAEDCSKLEVVFVRLRGLFLADIIYEGTILSLIRSSVAVQRGKADLIYVLLRQLRKRREKKL